MQVTTPTRPLPSTSGETGTSRQRTGWLWLFPGLMSLAFGLYHAGRPQLWRDEFASVNAASRSLGDLFKLLGNLDASTGLYYVLLHFWISLFGSSPAVLRLPSALAMAGAAILITQIGTRLYGTASGVAAGLVFALIPAISRYGQEARAYALVLFAVALATLLLLRALDRPGRGRWAAYAAAIVLVGAAHLVAVSCLAGHAVAVALRWHRDRDRGPVLGFTAAIGAALVIIAPLILFAHSQVDNQLSWLGPPDLADPVHVAIWLWIDLFASRRGAILAALLIILALVIPLIRRRQRSTALFLFASGALPPIAIAVTSQFGTSYFLGRYLLFTDVAWSLLAGAGLVTATSLVTARVRTARAARTARAGQAAQAGSSAGGPARVLGSGWAVPAAAVAAVALGLLVVWPNQVGVRAYGSHEWTHYPRGVSPGYISYQGSAQTLEHKARPGDGVVYLAYPALMVDLGVDYYLGSHASQLDTVFQTRTPQQNGSYASTDCTRPAACLAKAPDRIWLVEYEPYWGGSKLQNIERGLLAKDYRISTTYRLSRMAVKLLVRKD